MFLLHELTSHPNIKTISDKVSKLWHLMCEGTYLKADQGTLQALSDSQLRALRKMTVLSVFQGRNVSVG